MSAPDLVVQRIGLADPLAAPLLAGLTHEYRVRYGAGADREMSAYDGSEFDPPDGGFLVLTSAGTTVAGGGFRRHGPDSAELKRVWTSPAHRRTGLARRLLAELEAEAAGRGYRSLFLVTGPRQPEAHRLYVATGYDQLPDELTPEGQVLSRFAKTLG